MMSESEQQSLLQDCLEGERICRDLNKQDPEIQRRRAVVAEKLKAHGIELPPFE